MPEDPVTEARLLIERSRRELIEQLRGLVDRGYAQSERIDSALLTLTAGALLLSITFVGTLTTSKQCLVLLFAAWGAFIVSMICVIIAMMKAQYQSHESAVETATHLERFSALNLVDAAQQRVTFPVGKQKTVSRLNVIAVVCFVLGVACLCSFVAINLSHDKARTPAVPATPNQAMQRTADRRYA